VQVLNHGLLPDSRYYFIDMELCDLSLHDFIHRRAPPKSSESIPHFVRDAGPTLMVQQIWNIMREIANGVEYIHGQDQVHRDIKPANSTFPGRELLMSISFILTQGLCVEIGGFRANVGRHVEH
jgi:serine/threonine protein kinase